MEPTTATPQSSDPAPDLSRVTAAAEQVRRLLTVLAWMRASRIRPATLETLLAVAAGANTPQEIQEITAHPPLTPDGKPLPGLSRNGTWTALKVLLGAGQGYQRGKVLPPRCPPLIGRRPDPDAGRERCWRYATTDDGLSLLELLLGPLP